MLMLSFKEERTWLPEKLLNIEELIFYLTKLNDNIMVYVKKIYNDVINGDKIYEMSNGISYQKDADGNWFIV
jgi:hypothetical protein